LKRARAQKRVPLGINLARYVTDIHTNKDNQSAATTAMRFAEGRTTIEGFEE